MKFVFRTTGFGYKCVSASVPCNDVSHTPTQVSLIPNVNPRFPDRKLDAAGSL